jgi:DNA primase
MVNRVAHRLGVKEQTIWSRLRELKRDRDKAKEAAESRANDRASERAAAEAETPRAEAPQPESPPIPESSGPAPEREKALLEVLLGKPELVARVEADGLVDKVSHPVIRRLLQALCGLHAEGKTPDLDHLRESVTDERLLKGVLRLYDAGVARPDPVADYERFLDDFRRLDEVRRNQTELKAKLSETNDHATAVEELAKLLKQRSEFKNNKEGQSPV